MKHLLRVYALLCILSLTSCMTTYKAYEDKSVINGLVGMTQDRIIEYLGAPSDIVNYQNGSILVYEGNEVAFTYSHPSRKVANPKLEVFCNNDDVCTSTRISQMENVRKFSTGKTIVFILLPLGLLALI